MGSCDNDFIELHSSVHTPHIGLVPDTRNQNLAKEALVPAHPTQPVCPTLPLPWGPIKLGLYLLHSRLNVHQLPEVVRGMVGVPRLSHVLVPGPCHLDLVGPCSRLIFLI